VLPIILHAIGKVIQVDYKALGQRIRQQRKLMEMTQEELASVSDVSTSYIGHIERGIKHCSLETLVCICNALNIPPNSLLQDSLEHPPVETNIDLSPTSRSLLNSFVQLLKEHDQKDQDEDE
jgi:transcriptional regulator with XRE-family HTH domain